MGPYFEPCVKALLRSGDREDADECNLRMSSYEAINVLIGATTPECTNLVKQLVPLFCNKLAKCIEQVKAGQKIADQLLGLLIGAIQTCINKLDADILQFANGIMHVLLPVFEVRNSTTQEEAFMAIGALANAIEARFLTYVVVFKRNSNSLLIRKRSTRTLEHQHSNTNARTQVRCVFDVLT